MATFFGAVFQSKLIREVSFLRALRQVTRGLILFRFLFNAVRFRALMSYLSSVIRIKSPVSHNRFSAYSLGVYLIPWLYNPYIIHF